VKRFFRQTSVSRSNLTDSVVGENASLTRIGGNYAVHNDYGATVAVQLRQSDVRRRWLPTTHEPCLGRDGTLQGIRLVAIAVAPAVYLGLSRPRGRDAAGHEASDAHEKTKADNRVDA
jgi:hypothetical protein